MKQKNEFRLWTGLAAILLALPGAAHADQQKGNTPSPPPLAQIAPAAISVPYRLTYTLTEMNDGKRAGSQRYVIVVNASPKYFMSSNESRPAHLKLGSRMPIATGESAKSEITYIDIGMSIDATLRLGDKGLVLSTHIAESSIDHAQQLPGASEKAPVIRQAGLETSVLLTENKPTVIGNVDLPGTTRTLQIQVEATKLQ
jgi:hypothetical protein